MKILVMNVNTTASIDGIVGAVKLADRRALGTNWYCSPMETTVDQVGRIVIPKALRDRLGLVPGSTVEVSEYGAGLHLAPGGRTARLSRRSGKLVAVSETTVTDADVLALVDAGRR